MKLKVGNMGSICNKAVGVFFEYDTPRIVHIRSKKVGVINRLIQLIIIAYVIGYAIVYKKGYQEVDAVQSAVTTKVKGVVYVNQSEYPDITTSVWDVAEYIVPPQENNAFFVITNLIETPKQTIGICSEDPKVIGSNCTTSSQCPAGKVLPAGNGVLTGECNTTAGRCLVHAWCPVENGALKPPVNPALLGSKDFTVFIKNNIQFPKFKVKRRNLPDNASDEFFQTCNYGSHSIDCPILRLETIVREAGENYTDMAKEGGVIEIQIQWNCNLDLSVTECVPKYIFRRLDSADYKISKGYNFRYAKYYKENDTEYRTLYKAFGIKFILSVTGEAGKFNLEPFLINVGSGIGLLGIATVLCDIVVLYFLKAKSLYKDKKYLQVVGDDAYKFETPLQIDQLQLDGQNDEDKSE
ncbi:P2X purinoceptor 4-like isoform X2 [Mytilus californianus]|uniref:P2X purinoceptor 4-like isoform X2 n=1 Tax=Mytilus californianus TaxID=6549 RepID=UPI0022483305|nr:P2X purinoceptor 4-like isoform X2 [Mytilus californianus]